MDNFIKNIEKKFITNRQLSNIKIKDNAEQLMDIKKLDNSIILSVPPENLPFTGETIYLRQSVAKKLTNIQKILSIQNFSLKITDGYRPLQIQQEYWDLEMKKNKKKYPNFSLEELEEESSKFIAKPELALHPTGGAVDLTIVDLKSEKELDMGTPIDEFSERSYIDYNLFSAEILKNRRLLFSLMEAKEFYNLPSEWWHFSYGTIDWSLYYEKKFAIYGIKNFQIN